MTKSIKIKTLWKKLIILLLICTLVVVGGYYFLLFKLNQNGISFESKDFDFPSTLAVYDLKVKNQSLNAEVSKLALNWSWRSLLKGSYVGDYISIEGATINQQVLADTVANNEAAPFELPRLHFKVIRIKDAHYQQVADNDSLKLFINHFTLSGVDISKEITIDSVVSSGGNFAIFSDGKSDNSDTNGFTINAIPAFDLAHVDVRHFDFDIINPKQKHSFHNIRFGMKSLKSKELVDLKLEQLAFVYQDTLDFDMQMGEGSLNGQNHAVLNNLSFSLPQLHLEVPELIMDFDSVFYIEASFGRSYIDTKLITSFFHTALPFKTYPQADFSGTAAYSDYKLHLDKFKLELTEDVKLTASGSTEFKSNGTIDLQVDPLQVSSTEVKKILAYELDIDKDINLSSQLKIAGTYDHLKINSNAIINGNHLHIASSIDQLPKQITNITFDIQSDKVSPSAFIDSLESHFITHNLSLSAAASFSNSKFSSFQTKLTCDSILINEYWLHKPTIEAAYSNRSSFVNIKSLQENVALYLETPDNIFTETNLNYKGHLSSPVPRPTDLSMLVGQLYTSLNGQVSWQKNSFELSTTMDSVDFHALDNNQHYYTSGSFSFSENKQKDELRAGGQLGSKNVFSASASTTIIDYFQQALATEKLPIFTTDLRLEIDSIFFKSIMGSKGFVKLKNLTVNGGNNQMNATIDLPQFMFEDYKVHNLKAFADIEEANYKAQLNISSLENDLTTMDSLVVKVATDADKKIHTRVSSHFPAIEEKVVIHTQIAQLEGGYLLQLAENEPLVFGNRSWQVTDNKGFLFNKSFKSIYSHLAINNNNQQIVIDTKGEIVSLAIDSLKLGALTQLFVEDYAFSGALNLEGSYNMQTQSLQYDGGIYNMEVDSIPLGQIILNGYKNEQGWLAKNNLVHNSGEMALTLSQKATPINYMLDLIDLDLRELSLLIPNMLENVQVEGKLNGHVKGSYDQQLKADGYLTMDSVQSGWKTIGLTAFVANETIRFDDERVEFDAVKIADGNGQELILDGEISLNENPALNLRATSEAFTVLDKDDAEDISGKMQIATQLAITGPMNQLSVKGYINTLANSKINYTYGSTVSLDDREKEVTFVSFDELKKKGTPRRISNIAKNNPIVWDVDLNISNTDIYILLYETTQDNIKMTASGNLELRKGIGDLPYLFGTLKSTDGSVFYDAPMVSDLNLNIENLALTWQGDMLKPKLTFLGSEVFRLTPNEISSFWENKADRVPVTLLARVDDSPLNNFDVHFDLRSDNGEVANYLYSLPADTRETYAIGLLLFGKINTSGEAGQTSYLQSIVTKLNEISRRNVKNANLSFYLDENLNQTSSTQTDSRLGFSFSKGLFDKKVRVELGGNLDFNNSSHGRESFTPISNIKVDYILKEEPEITINASKTNEYQGAIDGQVDQGALGITFKKTYRNLFNIFRKQDK